jgi:Lycopene cyclase protein.
MDFRVAQDAGTTFVYVMPFTPTRALVEYTLFTEKLLEPSAYDQGLETYTREFLKPGNTK